MSVRVCYYLEIRWRDEMRIAELHTLPKEAVRAILENHEYSQLYVPAFSKLWHQAQVVIDVCSAILRSPVDDETGH